MNRAAIYARVSDKAKQGDNFSLPSQLKIARQYCADSGYEIVAELVEKASATQDGLTRVEINRAQDLARLGLIDVLIYYLPSRFTRKMVDGVLLRGAMYTQGVRMVCLYPTPHEVTEDRELINIIEDWSSQKDADNRREASMRGTQEKVEQAAYPQGVCPYGYRVVGKKADSHLEKVDVCAATVRQIYDWFVIDRVPTAEIAKRLTALAVPTPTQARGNHYSVRKRAEGEWSADMVYTILRNEAYTGIWNAFRYQKDGDADRWIPRPRSEWIPIEIPVIIERPLWKRAQELLKTHASARTRQHTYLMSRRARCICGVKMHGMCGATRKDGSTALYYECQSRGCVGGKCGAPFYRADDVDHCIWSWMRDLLANPERVLRDYREAQTTLNERHALLLSHVAGCNEQIGEYTAKLTSLIESRATARAESVKQALDRRIDELGLLIDGLAAKREELTRKLEAETITDEAISQALGEIAEVREEIEDITRTDDREAKRRLVEALDIRVTLRADEAGQRWCDIHWCLKVYPVRSVNLTRAGRNRSARCRA
jgi:site-specific DNA recombinase